MKRNEKAIKISLIILMLTMWMVGFFMGFACQKVKAMLDAPTSFQDGHHSGIRLI